MCVRLHWGLSSALPPLLVHACFTQTSLFLPGPCGITAYGNMAKEYGDRRAAMSLSGLGHFPKGLDLRDKQESGGWGRGDMGTGIEAPVGVLVSLSRANRS